MIEDLPGNSSLALPSCPIIQRLGQFLKLWRTDLRKLNRWFLGFEPITDDQERGHNYEALMTSRFASAEANHSVAVLKHRARLFRLTSWMVR
jgi:hypothetical protein